MSLNWEALEDALYAFVSAKLGIKTHWQHQRIPRPARPYATLRLGSVVALGHDETSRAFDPDAKPGEELVLTTTGNRELTLTVNVYSDVVTGSGTARERLSRLQTAIEAPLAIEALWASGISVVDRGAVLDLTELLETGFESRAALDVRLLVRDLVTESTTFIEHVGLTNNIES